MAFSLVRPLVSSATSSTMTNNNDTIDQETIESLCDRLQSATRIEDRRDAVHALKALSKKCKLEVGTKSITLLGNILQGDRTDLDLIQLVLETLTNMITYDVGSDEEQLNLPQDITVKFTELYIKNKKNVHALLEFIAETDFNIRRAAIRFLTALLTNCTEELQNIILESGRVGFSKLFDLLEDKHEVIRNDAVLLFEILIRSNWYIQEIVVLENGFERLLRILISKRDMDGDVTVEDCLSVLLNLLENNQSNQRCFCECSYLSRLFGFFELGLIGENRWSEQKVANNSSFITSILRRLCVMLTLTTVPADILAEILNTIGNVVRGNAENQKFLGFVKDMTGDVPQPILFDLFCTMAADKEQSFRIRISILYCLQCYLYKNDFGKSIIVQTLLPQTENGAKQYTLGHLLIIGYLSKDIVASWCSGIALAHLISDSQQYKEAILKVVLTVDQSQTDVKTLMEISIDLLQNDSSSFHTRIAVLIFLCTWLSNCSLAVQSLLSIENSISYLISQICAQSIADDRELVIQSLCSFALGLCLVFNNNQVQSYSTESLKQLINKRIGIDLFREKLEILSKSEYYVAMKQPLPKLEKPSDMILDYEFARLYETLESSISRMLTRHDINSTDRTLIDPMSTNLDAQQISTMMTPYNDLIRQQDEQINIYKQKEKQPIQECDIYKEKILALEQQRQEIKDKNALLNK